MTGSLRRIEEILRWRAARSYLLSGRGRRLRRRRSVDEVDFDNADGEADERGGNVRLDGMK